MSITILKSKDVKNYLIKTSNILSQFPSFIENISSKEKDISIYFPDLKEPILKENNIKLISDILQNVEKEKEVVKYIEIYIKKHILDKFKILDLTMSGNHYFYDYINKYFNFKFNSYDVYISHIVYTVRKLSKEDLFYPYMDMVIFIADKWIKEDVDKNLIIDICKIQNRTKNNYIRLFMRCIESLHEWLTGKGGYHKRESLDDTRGNILEMLDHDWLKISSHGALFIKSETSNIFDSEDDYFDEDFFDYTHSS